MYIDHRFLRVHLEVDDVHYRQEALNLAAWREHVSREPSLVTGEYEEQSEEQSASLDACSSAVLELGEFKSAYSRYI